MKTSIRLIIIVVSVLVVVLGGFELLRGKQVRTHMQAAFVAEGLAVTGMLRVAAAEYYNSHGEWPESHAEANLPAPYQITRQALTSAELGSDGVITLTYNAKSGVDGGTIRLVPSVSSYLGDIKWECRTSSFENIQEWAPQCMYIQ
ncbi:MAG: pilin [Gammaproteobacteria bacterium]